MIHTCKNRIKDVRLKTKIQNSETQLTKNFFRCHIVIDNVTLGFRFKLGQKSGSGSIFSVVYCYIFYNFYMILDLSTYILPLLHVTNIILGLLRRVSSSRSCPGPNRFQTLAKVPNQTKTQVPNVMNSRRLMQLHSLFF